MLTYRPKLFHFLPTSQLESTTNHMLVNNPTFVTNYLYYSHNWLPNRVKLRYTLPYNLGDTVHNGEKGMVVDGEIDGHIMFTVRKQIEVNIIV